MAHEIGDDLVKDAPTLKIKRPKLSTFTETHSEDISQNVLRVTEPETRMSEDEILKAYAESDDKISDTERVLKTIDWGEFDIDRLVDLLVMLRKAITGQVLYEGYQVPFERRIYKSALENDGAELTAIFSRQSGKTEAVACAIVTLCIALPALAKSFPDQLAMYKDGFWVGIYAPSGTQAQTLYSRVLDRAYSDNARAVMTDPDFNIFPVANTRWSNGSLVYCQSADKRSKVESKTYHLLVLEECQDLDDRMVEKSLLPMLASTNGTCVMVGTAMDRRCYFLVTITRNKVDDIRRPEDRTHYEYDYLVVQQFNPRYAAYVAKQIRRYGKDSPFFQMSFMNKWLVQSGMAVTEAELKSNCMATTYGITHSSDRQVVVGIDQARNHNRTVVTVSEITATRLQFDDDSPEELMLSARIIGWLELRDISWPQQRRLIVQYLSGFSYIRLIVLDATGAGKVQLEDFQEEYPDLPMTGFIFSGKSKEELKELFYEYFSNKRLQIPTTKDARKTKEWQAFWIEWTNVEKVTIGGYTYFQKPNRVGAYDDYVDSTLLMLWGVSQIAKEVDSDGSIDAAATLIFKPERAISTPKNFAAIRERYRSGGQSVTAQKSRHNKLLRGMLT